MFLSWIIRNGGNHAKNIQNGGKLIKRCKRVENHSPWPRIHTPEPYMHSIHFMQSIRHAATNSCSTTRLRPAMVQQSMREAPVEVQQSMRTKKGASRRTSERRSKRLAVGLSSRLDFCPSWKPIDWFIKVVDWILRVVDWFNMSIGWGSLRKACRQLAAAEGVFSRKEKQSNP